jgi:hypothetical protein
MALRNSSSRLAIRASRLFCRRSNNDSASGGAYSRIWFPDLFARAQPTVGPPALGIWVPPAEPTGGEQSLTQRMLGSVRNVPFLIWDETTDELVPIAGVLEQVKAFDELGYRYEFDQFQAGEHLTLALNDEYAPAAAFLGTETIDSDPAHVTYTYNRWPADGHARRVPRQVKGRNGEPRLTGTPSATARCGPRRESPCGRCAVDSHRSRESYPCPHAITARSRAERRRG